MTHRGTETQRRQGTEDPEKTPKNRKTTWIHYLNERVFS